MQLKLDLHKCLFLLVSLNQRPALIPKLLNNPIHVFYFSDCRMKMTCNCNFSGTVESTCSVTNVLWHLTSLNFSLDSSCRTFIEEEKQWLLNKGPGTNTSHNKTNKTQNYTGHGIAVGGRELDWRNTLDGMELWVTTIVLLSTSTRSALSDPTSIMPFRIWIISNNVLHVYQCCHKW